LTFELQTWVLHATHHLL